MKKKIVSIRRVCKGMLGTGLSHYIMLIKK